MSTTKLTNQATTPQPNNSNNKNADGSLKVFSLKKVTQEGIQNQSSSDSSTQFRNKLQKQNKALFEPHSPHKVFYTDVLEQETVSDKQQIDSYISGLQKKIEDAKWKQDLLLSYNYVPLQTIKEKIELETNVYRKRIEQFQANYNRIFQDADFTNQLQGLREFNLKLREKMKDYELKVEEQRVHNTVLKTQADHKRAQLKELIKSNMELSKSLVERMGATSKDDIVRIVRSRSQQKFKTKNSSVAKIDSLQKKMSSLLKRSASSAKSMKIDKVSKVGLFEECLQKLVSSIIGMKSTQDVQDGIFLEIMQKKQPIQLSVSKAASHRSTISNTLHERYKEKIHRRDNTHFEEDDFEMEWEVFRELNWKQILGILLVKDKNCKKLKATFASSLQGHGR